MNQPTMNILPRTIGVDLGSKSSVFCVLDESGKIAQEGSIAMSRKRVRQFFEDEPQSRVILEASGSSRWTAQVAMELGHEVVMGNPWKMSYITKSVTKSDRNDAFKLADLGQVRPRLLSPVRLRSNKSHEGRMHQRVRSQLIATRTALINCVRGCARTSGFRLRTDARGTGRSLPPTVQERHTQALLKGAFSQTTYSLRYTPNFANARLRLALGPWRNFAKFAVQGDPTGSTVAANVAKPRQEPSCCVGRASS